MLKLYKNNRGTLHYWETWDIDNTSALIHWGIVGERGQDKEVYSKPSENFRDMVQKEIDLKIFEGYEQVDLDEHYILLVEYSVKGMGTPEDIDKRTRLQDKADQILGWTGLGHCDGGSIGSNTMEICCYVVNFDMAKQVFEKALEGTEFADYSRIYNENEE